MWGVVYIESYTLCVSTVHTHTQRGRYGAKAYSRIEIEPHGTVRVLYSGLHVTHNSSHPLTCTVLYGAFIKITYRLSRKSALAITVFLGKHAVVKTSLLVIQIPSDHTRTQLGPSVIIGKVGVQKYISTDRYSVLKDIIHKENKVVLCNDSKLLSFLSQTRLQVAWCITG